ncbi:LytR/AlgR family response regulator transcription factor [Mucilaginibacter dorajii]|uniref:LytTR family DNA-binding domain-containing protein n=1 Tax=Mucilaginibacter dorajii TaxID=692994 RepID=A0ABP7P8Q4_9SPHI|nr:LytTR family DNA-binding domain-containing protein [Mucilaginibacter dorajii]MCS3736610.1 DNA-binding LytR/AlgR family response regulator [Mucilaginibacter dorajii]
MINCVIIDDEPLAREGLGNYVREVDFLNLGGIGENPLELLHLIDQQKIDLIFLDIQMPKMNGIEFLKILQKPPMVVITTAYPSYALEGFQLNVLDYLLKPITFERFFKAATKARDYHKLLTGDPAKQAEDYFFIRCGNKYEKVFFEDILYIEGMQNYVTIYSTKGKYITMLSLKSLEEKLPGAGFIRVHKSFMAAVNKIDSIEPAELMIGGNRIPISRGYREMVMEQVLNKKLLNKK